MKFEETQWDAIFAGLDAGRFDVIANQVSINAERQAKYDFSDPYTVSTGVIVVKKGDDSDISSFDDLKGKTTAQSLTSNWYSWPRQAGAKVEAVEGWAQAVTLLRAGPRGRDRQRQAHYLDYSRPRRHRTSRCRARPMKSRKAPSPSARAATIW